MTSTPEFGFNELLAQLVGEIATSVCERSGETAQQQFARSQAAVHMIMGFLPRDVVEALLAGHCVMLHETMLASVHDTLHGEAEDMRHGTRSTLVAMNKEFNSNLGHLARYQARPAAGRRETPRAAEAVMTASTGATLVRPASAETSAAATNPSTATPATGTPSPARPTQSGAAVSAVQQELDWLVEHDPESKMEYHPSPAMLAECQANPEAMAALAAGDPAGFAKALGIAIPDEAFLEAANTAGSPFDPEATGPWPANPVSGRRTG
jgi:hypothetical protein